MSPLDYTVKRVQSFLHEITRLLDSDFPYLHSKNALLIIEQMLKAELNVLNQFSTESDEDIINHTCTLVLRKLYIYLPILGFILRSTNVRNAFEVFGPILRLACNVLEPNTEKKNQKTQLILSSEWDYSPYVYRELPDLPGFALIGLPAPESSNPLLVPWSGHELGHLSWVKNALKAVIEPLITRNIFSAISDRWNEYVQIFPIPKINPEDLGTNILAVQNWRPAQAWALKQAEETFSDFVALCVFGISFLHAYAYLLSPNLSEIRSIYYPNMRTRVRNLVRAGEAYEMAVPPDYLLQFIDSSNPPLTEADTFRLSIADEALEMVIDELISKVKGIIEASGITKSSADEEKVILEHFFKVIPAENAKCLADILNAAWRAFRTQDLWKGIPQVEKNKDFILKEIVLKNIEVFEIEQIQSESI